MSLHFSAARARALTAAPDLARENIALREAVEGAREQLALLANKQADQRGDYLYRGQPDSVLLTAIGLLDAALKSSESSK